MAKIPGKKKLRELYADIPVRRRGAFMARALGLLEESFDELGDSKPRAKIEAVKSAMQAFDLIEGVAKKVTDQEEAMMRLAKLVLGGSDAPSVTVIIKEAKLEQGDIPKPPSDEGASSS